MPCILSSPHVNHSMQGMAESVLCMSGCAHTAQHRVLVGIVAAQQCGIPIPTNIVVQLCWLAVISRGVANGAVWWYRRL